MKLVTYLKEEHDQLALLVNGMLYDTDMLHPDPQDSALDQTYKHQSLYAIDSNTRL